MRGGLRTAYGPTICRRVLIGLAAIAVLGAAPCAAEGAKPQAASTSENARRDAMRAISIKQIDPAYQKRVSAVLSDPSLFRRMPTNVVDCRPEMFTYMAQNPDVLVAIWRDLGLSQVELTRTGQNTFKLQDNAGTTGTVVVVEQKCDAAAQNRIVMFAEGSYDGKPFNKPVSAQCVIVLRSGSVRETNGRQYVAVRMDSFVKLDRTSLELLAQALHPFVGKTADRNFADTVSFVSNLSYTAEKRPQAIESLAQGLVGVEQDRRDQLASLARQCAAEGRKTAASHAAQASLETVER